MNHQIGEIVCLRNKDHLPKGLVTVPEGHPPWSEDWDIVTTFAPWEVGFVVDIAHNPKGSLFVKLFTSHGGGWIEGSELTNL